MRYFKAVAQLSIRCMRDGGKDGWGEPERIYLELRKWTAKV